MKCKGCGREISSDLEYCIFCGHKQSNDNEQLEQTLNVKETNSENEQLEFPINKHHEEVKSLEDPKPKIRRRLRYDRLIVLVVIVVLFLSLIGFGLKKGYDHFFASEPLPLTIVETVANEGLLTDIYQTNEKLIGDYDTWINSITEMLITYNSTDKKYLIKINNKSEYPYDAKGNQLLMESSQLAVNLKTLTFNNVDSIKLPSEKMSITKLTLENCKTVKIENINLMTDLEEISAKNCGLEDISNFVPLNNLQKLYLQGNNITDLASLDGKALAEINVANNKIRSFTALRNCVAVEIVNPDSITKKSQLTTEHQEGVDQLEIVADAIGIRNETRINAEKYGNANDGEYYYILEQVNQDGYSWYKVGYERWIPVKDSTWAKIVN